MINVKETIEANQLRTARGRRQISGKEIDINAAVESRSRRAATIRAEGYLEIIRELQNIVGSDPEGISYDELDATEFIIEQLERVARRAWETAIEKN